MDIRRIEPLHGRALRDRDGPEQWAVWLGDGRLVSGGDQPTLRVWDARAGALVMATPAAIDVTIAAASLPDGTLVVGSADGTLQALDCETGTARFVRANHGGARQIRYAAEAGLIVTAGDGAIRFNDPVSGKRRRTLLRVGQPIHGLAVTPDLRLIGATHARGLQIWQDGREVFRLDGYYYHGGKGQEDIAFLGGGRFACASFRRSPELCLWDLEDAGAPPVAIAELFPDDIYTYAASHVPAPQRALRLGRQAHDFAVAPDERLIALVLVDEIVLVRSATLEVVAFCPVPLGDRAYRGGPASAPAFSPDGRLLSAVSDGRIWIWEIPHDQ